MQSKKTAQKMHIGIIPTTLILAAIALVFILLVRQKYETASVDRIGGTPVTTEHVSAIKNVQGLDDAMNELNSQDPTTFNQDLNQINSAASGF